MLVRVLRCRNHSGLGADRLPGVVETPGAVVTIGVAAETHPTESAVEITAPIVTLRLGTRAIDTSAGTWLEFLRV